MANRAAELRAAFDRAFAASVQDGEAPLHVDVLLIRVADQGYALRLAEVQAVHTDRKLVPVPAPAAELLGLVGLRGAVAPIYDLRRLMGHPAGPVPRWLALARWTSPIGVAFDALDAHLRLPIGELVMAPPGEAAGKRFTSGSVRTASGPRPLLDLPALLESITLGKPAHGVPQREGPR